MAVVDPDERTATAGITNVARTTAGAVAPVLSGAALGAGALGLPFLLAGALKIVYDAWSTRPFAACTRPRRTRERPCECRR